MPEIVLEIIWVDKQIRNVNKINMLFIKMTQTMQILLRRALERHIRMERLNNKFLHIIYVLQHFEVFMAPGLAKNCWRCYSCWRRRKEYSWIKYNRDGWLYFLQVKKWEKAGFRHSYVTCVKNIGDNVP